MWRTRKYEHSVVVLGAGFAGIECAKRLVKKLKKRASTHVALVDKENHSVFQPLLPEVASASIASHHVVNPVRMLAQGADFDCAEVERIDFDAKLVHFKPIEGMDMTPMPFTHLVFALGTVPNMGIIPGMAAHGLAMKTVGDAYFLRNHVIMRLEMAANTADSELRRELLTVVTVGAGFSGVETCAEVHDMMTAALRYFPELQGETIRSMLVSSSDRILPSLSPSLSKYALDKLRKRGVEVLLSKRASSVTPRACFLNDGSEVATRTVVSTIGNSPHPVVVGTPLEKHRGRLLVDEHMRCKGYDNLWAIGDCASIINGVDGEPCPPTAQFSVREGTQCADNIVRSLAGEELKPFSFKQMGYAASLGHMSAVLELGPLRLSGFLAWWMWRTIYLMKLPGWYRRLRVCIDWTVSLFFPRDICQLGTSRSDRVGREHYEPGQDIVCEGDKGDSFYTLINGEVEVVRCGDDACEQLVARLGPGSYFGEEALLSGEPRSATVRALTACDLLCLGRSDFRALADNLGAMGDTLRQTRKPLTAVEAAHDDDVRRALKRLTVGSRMQTGVVSLRGEQTLEEMCHCFQEHGFAVFPVLGDKEKLIGLLSRDELHEALNRGVDPKVMTVGELTGTELVTAFPEDELCTTMDRFHQQDVERMCVVARDSPRKLLGMLSVNDVLQARIEIELVLRNPDTAETLALPDKLIDELHAHRAEA